MENSQEGRDVIRRMALNDFDDPSESINHASVISRLIWKSTSKRASRWNFISKSARGSAWPSWKYFDESWLKVLGWFDCLHLVDKVMRAGGEEVTIWITKHPMESVATIQKWKQFHNKFDHEKTFFTYGNVKPAAARHRDWNNWLTTVKEMTSREIDFNISSIRKRDSCSESADFRCLIVVESSQPDTAARCRSVKNWSNDWDLNLVWRKPEKKQCFHAKLLAPLNMGNWTLQLKLFLSLIGVSRRLLAAEKKHELNSIYFVDRMHSAVHKNPTTLASSKIVIRLPTQQSFSLEPRSHRDQWFAASTRGWVRNFHTAWVFFSRKQHGGKRSFYAHYARALQWLLSCFFLLLFWMNLMIRN